MDRVKQQYGPALLLGAMLALSKLEQDNLRRDESRTALVWLHADVRLLAGRRMKAYRQDLAYIHDVGFSSFAEHAAPALLDMLQRVGVTDGLVIDLGCGSGLWARCLVDAGYAVLGIDISRDMLALARNRVPERTFRAASFVEEDFPECAAITSLGECLNYLFDERHAFLLGSGIPVFSGAVPKTDLELVGQKIYSSGFMLLSYRLKH